MNTIYEINMTNEQPHVNMGREIHTDKPTFEVFSALTSGRTPNVSPAAKDLAVKVLKEMGDKAVSGDPIARSEINTLIRFAVEPKLLENVRLFSFLGSFKKIGYNETPMMRVRKYDNIDSRIQASSSDVPFGAVDWYEYPIATQTISSGVAVDYREIQSGNFDGSLAEAMSQVQIDMRNKVAYFIISMLHDTIKNAPRNNFEEANGITKTAVDNLLKKMRRYTQGEKVNIAGDYAVISQLNDFAGFRQFAADEVRYGNSAVSEEIRASGILSTYNGATVTELPNAINWTKPSTTGTGYDLYLPEGLMFFLPKSVISPLQMFQRGDITTMTGDDIVTRKHLVRFDLEFGAGVAKGMEDHIGLLHDLNYALPTL